MCDESAMKTMFNPNVVGLFRGVMWWGGGAQCPQNEMA